MSLWSKGYDWVLLPLKSGFESRWGHVPLLRVMGGRMTVNGNYVVWTIVGVLAIIALIIYIL
jgi:hypothetical protein